MNGTDQTQKYLVVMSIMIQFIWSNNRSSNDHFCLMHLILMQGPNEIDIDPPSHGHTVYIVNDKMDESNKPIPVLQAPRKHCSTTNPAENSFFLLAGLCIQTTHI